MRGGVWYDRRLLMLLVLLMLLAGSVGEHGPI